MMAEKDPRFTNLKRRVGIFIIVALSLITIALVFIGLRRDLFVSNVNILFIADSGANINDGQAVKFKGFRIGKVKKVSLNEQGRVVVTLNIHESYLKFIHEDSVAMLSQEGMLGDYNIEITGGSQAKPQAAEGATLAFQRTITLGDVAQEMKVQLENVIGEIQKITAYIIDPQGDVKLTLANLRKLSQGMVETRDNLDALLVDGRTDMNRTLSKLDRTIDNINEELIPETLEAIKDTRKLLGTSDGAVADRNKDLAEAMKKVNLAMDNMVEVSRNLKGTSEGLSGMVTEGGLLMEDTHDVVKGVKGVWPIKGNIPKMEQRLLELDSYKK